MIRPTVLDPLAVVLLIPLFAVRSGKFAELLEMETELDYRDVKSLPNWSLNIALSLIHLNEIDLAKEKLVKCLSDHPGLLFPLLEKMQGNIHPFYPNISWLQSWLIHCNLLF